MLGLNLRDEFKGRRLKGTAIELSNNSETGATQIPAADFLRITYPSTDLLKTLEFAEPNRGRPITLIGERGQGKSHLMGALFHALNNPRATQQWLNDWANILPNAMFTQIQLRLGMHVISESLHRQRYKHLWDLLFENHPHGKYCRGKWEGLGEKKTEVPSDEVLLEMFRHKPTALILDEFQTWFDGLTNSRVPNRTWAFNFIQILSEIAFAHPELLVLVVSVRNGDTDAFQQIQRVGPVIVDFKGLNAKHDRLRLLLHRLFENRLQVQQDQIANLIETHITEYFRLKNSPPDKHDRLRTEFHEAWPYAPHLIQLLEDQVLMATQAQGTRDLIKVLADLFKRVGDDTPIVTAADFRLDQDDSGIASLLDSVANQHHAKLREKALRNLEAVRDAVAGTNENLPHLEGIIGALWLRSLADVNQAGADRVTLHIDVTRNKRVDDTPFEVELNTIVENSFNIHEDGNRYIFKEEVNPQAKLIASARNDKSFDEGEDIVHLAREVRYVLAGNPEVASRFRVIVLPQFWRNDPWEKVDESDRPERWDDRIPVIVLPESPTDIASQLGLWLRDNLQKNRNAVRFLVPKDGSPNLFSNRELVVLSRCVYLAEKWKTENPEYVRFQAKYQKELREILKSRFDRFAIISNWNFQEPQNCRFYIESHNAEGARVAEAVDKQIVDNLFVSEDFKDFILSAAPNNESVGKLLRELKEPRPAGNDCIPWLGETIVKERIIRLCAKGLVAINIRGMEYLQVQAGESEEAAWKRMRGKLGTGKHLDETYVLLPQNVPATSGFSVSDPTNSGAVFPLPGNTVIGDTGATSTLPGGTGAIVENTLLLGNGPIIPGNIFGDANSNVPVAIPATSALNLLGRIESHGIKPGTQIKSLNVKIDKLTGAQLQELLKKLPDGLTYQLDMQKEQSQ